MLYLINCHNEMRLMLDKKEGTFDIIELLYTNIRYLSF